jgi:hypothetical protein
MEESRPTPRATFPAPLRCPPLPHLFVPLFQEVLVQAFEPAEGAPGPDPGLDPGLAYDSEKLSARDLYPFSPGPAEPTAYPQTVQGPPYGPPRSGYPAELGSAGPGPGYGPSSPGQGLPPADVGRPAPPPLGTQGAAVYAGGPGPYGSNWRSASAAPGVGPAGQVQGVNPQGFSYPGGYGQPPPQEAYLPWNSTPGGPPAQAPAGGGYDSARNADAARWYPQDAYQGVA